MQRKMRAKMKIRSINRLQGCEVLTLGATGNQGDPHEDNAFAKTTPDAEMTIKIGNPELLGKFNPGETLFLDFISVEDSQG